MLAQSIAFHAALGPTYPPSLILFLPTCVGLELEVFHFVAIAGWWQIQLTE
jgi:hypothetical protein